MCVYVLCIIGDAPRGARGHAGAPGPGGARPGRAERQRGGAGHGGADHAPPCAPAHTIQHAALCKKN